MHNAIDEELSLAACLANKDITRAITAKNLKQGGNVYTGIDGQIPFVA